MKPRTDSFIIKMLILAAISVALAAASFLKFNYINYNQISIGYLLIMALAAITAVRSSIYLAKKYKLDQGLNVFMVYREFIDQLMDVGCYIPTYNPCIVRLPQVRIDMDEEGLRGKIWIRNNLKYQSTLDSDISMAFSKYNVDSHYLSDDSNWYIFDLVRADYEKQFQFHSLHSFYRKNFGTSPYELLIDKDLSYVLCHTLICGQTGAGKSYATYSIVLQLLYKNADIFFVDPKNSGLSIMGDHIAPHQTAVTIDEIYEVLVSFSECLRARNKELTNRLHDRLDGDYMSFNWTPKVLIFEEFGAFQAALSGRDKKYRDEVNAMVEQIVLLGRQSGCFLILIAQQVSAQTLPTKIRDNIPAKFLLARGLEKETSTCCFGATDAAELQSKIYRPGEAYYKIAGINSVPKLCTFPLLDFDIDDAINTCLGSSRRRR